MADTLTAQGIAAAKAGDKKKAQQLLSQAVKQNPNDEKAWAYLYGCLDDPQQKRFCIERVLAINPNNEKARAALATLNTAVATPPPSPQLGAQPAPPRVPAFEADQPQPEKLFGEAPEEPAPEENLPDWLRPAQAPGPAPLPGIEKSPEWSKAMSSAKESLAIFDEAAPEPPKPSVKADQRYCPYCNEANSLAAETCQRCGRSLRPKDPTYSMPAMAEKKAGGERNWLLIGGLVLIGLCSVCCLIWAGLNLLARQQLESLMYDAPVGIEEATQYNTGDTVRFDTHTVKLNSAKISNGRLVANFTVVNQTDLPIAASPLINWNAVNENGEKLMPDFENCPDMLDGQVEAKGSDRGNACWLDAEGAITITYSDSPLGGAKVKWVVP